MDFWKFLSLIVFGSISTPYSVQGFTRISDTACGIQSVRGPKIVGGKTAFEGEFPWLVSIKEDGRHLCGGFIINNRFVVTAAHCFSGFSYRSLEQPHTIQVTLGEHNLQAANISDFALNVTVKTIKKHPNFTEINYENDIALLHLNENIEWNDHTRPVCLPEAHQTYSSEETKELAILVGWGHTKQRGSGEGWKIENSLNKVNLTVYDNIECQEMLRRKRISQKITPCHICAGYAAGGLDTCQGDSGGPALVQRERRWTAIGIVSAGRGCGRPGYPGIYTRVSSYLDWISYITQPKVSVFFNLFPSRRKFMNSTTRI